MWNLEPETWNLPPKKSKEIEKNRACGAGGTWNLGTWNLYLLTRDPRNRNLGNPQGVDFLRHCVVHGR